MAQQGSNVASHRSWIDRARSLCDEADERAAHDQSRAFESSILTADSFPGYELEREIHRGAQGIVFLAMQKSTGRHVALKLLHDHAFGGPLERARFEREMRILAALRHPNIVNIYDGGEHQGRAFLVMDYIAGQPLDLYMALQLRNVHESLRLFVQVCDAVNEAHVRGIIHRDLKPANVRVDANGKPFVLDFGLAKIVDASADQAGLATYGATATTMTGQFLGSLPWAAPEQTEGNSSRIDTRTDVYSLGVLLFQTLTGTLPYPVSGPMKSVLETIAHCDPTSPRTLRSDIDDDLETIILKCLSKDRERRYQTAGELASDLRRYLAGEPVDARRDSHWYVLRKTLYHYRGLVATAALFSTLLVFSTVIAWILWSRASLSARHAHVAELEASAARHNALASLHASLIGQARATRRTGRMGQRFDSLELLKKAAELNPDVEVRNEVIAASTLTDLRVVQRIRRSGLEGSFDEEGSRCALLDPDNGISVIRVNDELEIAKIPPPAVPIRELLAIEIRGPWLLRLFDPAEGLRRLEIWNIFEARLMFEVLDVPFRSRPDISPDGKTMAVGRADQAIHLLDIESQSEIKRFPLDRDPSYMTFDPSGHMLVLYHANFIEPRILNLDSDVLQPIFESKNVAWSVTWRADGKEIAAACGSNIEIWNVVAHRRDTVLMGHEDHIVHLMYSHDGRMLLSASWDGHAILWDMQARRPILQWNMTRPRFTPDDAEITGYLGGGLAVLRLERDAVRRQMGTGEESDERVNNCGAFLLGSQLFLAIDTDFMDQSTIQIYDVATGRSLLSKPFALTRGVAVESSGQFLVTAQQSGLFRWPLRVGMQHLFIGPPTQISDKPCDAVSINSQGEIVFGQISTGKFSVIKANGDSIATVGSGHPSASVRISPDGRWVAIGLWWARSGQTAEPAGEIWDIASATRVAQLPLAGLAQLEFSPDGTLLASSDSRSLDIWEAQTWRCLRRVANAGKLIQFSPDGQVLSVAPDEARIRLVHTANLDEIITLEPSDGSKTTECLASPDGRLLAQQTNRKGVVHVWDLDSIRGILRSMELDWFGSPGPSHDEESTNVDWIVTLIK